MTSYDTPTPQCPVKLDLNYFNKQLPESYRDDLQDEYTRMIALLKHKLAALYVKHELKTESAYWIKTLHDFMKLHELTFEDREFFRHIFMEMFLDLNLDMDMRIEAGNILISLLKEKKAKFDMDWRRLYSMMQQINREKIRPHSRPLDDEYAEHLCRIILECNQFYTVGTATAVLEEFAPKLCPTSADLDDHLLMLVAFLPLGHNIGSEEIERIIQFCFGLMEWKNDNLWNEYFLYILGCLAKHHLEMDWTPYVKRIFQKIHSNSFSVAAGARMNAPASLTMYTSSVLRNMALPNVTYEIYSLLSVYLLRPLSAAALKRDGPDREFPQDCAFYYFDVTMKKLKVTNTPKPDSEIVPEGIDFINYLTETYCYRIRKQKQMERKLGRRQPFFLGQEEHDAFVDVLKDMLDYLLRSKTTLNSMSISKSIRDLCYLAPNRIISYSIDMVKRQLVRYEESNECEALNMLDFLVTPIVDRKLNPQGLEQLKDLLQVTLPHFHVERSQVFSQILKFYIETLNIIRVVHPEDKEEEYKLSSFYQNDKSFWQLVKEQEKDVNVEGCIREIHTFYLQVFRKSLELFELVAKPTTSDEEPGETYTIMTLLIKQLIDQVSPRVLHEFFEIFDEMLYSQFEPANKVLIGSILSFFAGREYSMVQEKCIPSIFEKVFDKRSEDKANDPMEGPKLMNQHSVEVSAYPGVDKEVGQKVLDAVIKYSRNKDFILDHEIKSSIDHSKLEDYMTLINNTIQRCDQNVVKYEKELECFIYHLTGSNNTQLSEAGSKMIRCIFAGLGRVFIEFSPLTKENADHLLFDYQKWGQLDMDLKFAWKVPPQSFVDYGKYLLKVYISGVADFVETEILSSITRALTSSSTEGESGESENTITNGKTKETTANIHTKHNQWKNFCSIPRSEVMKLISLFTSAFQGGAYWMKGEDSGNPLLIKTGFSVFDLSGLPELQDRGIDICSRLVDTLVKANLENEANVLKSICKVYKSVLSCNYAVEYLESFKSLHQDYKNDFVCKIKEQKIDARIFLIRRMLFQQLRRELFNQSWLRWSPLYEKILDSHIHLLSSEYQAVNGAAKSIFLENHTIESNEEFINYKMKLIRSCLSKFEAFLDEYRELVQSSKSEQGGGNKKKKHEEKYKVKIFALISIFVNDKIYCLFFSRFDLFSQLVKILTRGHQIEDEAIHKDLVDLFELLCQEYCNEFDSTLKTLPLEVKYDQDAAGLNYLNEIRSENREWLLKHNSEVDHEKEIYSQGFDELVTSICDSLNSRTHWKFHLIAQGMLFIIVSFIDKKTETFNKIHNFFVGTLLEQHNQIRQAAYLGMFYTSLLRKYDFLEEELVPLPESDESKIDVTVEEDRYLKPYIGMSDEEKEPIYFDRISSGWASAPKTYLKIKGFGYPILSEEKDDFIKFFKNRENMKTFLENGKNELATIVNLQAMQEDGGTLDTTSDVEKIIMENLLPKECQVDADNKLFSDISSQFYKILFQLYGPEFLEALKPNLEVYAKDYESKTNQLIIIELAGGLIRATRYWNHFDATEALKYVAVLMKNSLENCTMEIFEEWDVLFEFISPFMDPARIEPILDAILRNPFKVSTSSMQNKLMRTYEKFVFSMNWRLHAKTKSYVLALGQNMVKLSPAARENALISLKYILRFSAFGKMKYNGRTLKMERPHDSIEANTTIALIQKMIQDAIKRVNTAGSTVTAGKLKTYKTIFLHLSMIYIDECSRLEFLVDEKLVEPIFKCAVNLLNDENATTSQKARTALIMLGSTMMPPKILEITHELSVDDFDLSVYTALLEDPSAEVRNAASLNVGCLAMACKESTVADLIDRFITMAQTPISKGEEETTGAFRRRLGGVSGVCGLISVFPGHLTTWMTRALIELSKHRGDPASIRKTIQLTIADFSKNNQEMWGEMKENISEHDMSRIQELRNPYNYFTQ